MQIRRFTLTLGVVVVTPLTLHAQHEPPATIVRAAQRAVEADSAPALRARWQARRARDASDRAATLGLATLARLTYDDTVARRLYDALAGAPPRDGYMAWARLGRGQLLDRQNQALAARDELEGALVLARAAADPVAEASALLELSFARANSVGVPAGFAALDSAARLIPDSALALRAEHLRRRTIILSAIGDPAARSTAATALTMARRTGDPGIEGRCLRALGQVHELTGQNDSALAIYAMAVPLLRRAHDRSALALTLIRRVGVLRAVGRMSEMRSTLAEALAEARAAHDEASVGATFTGLGTLYLQLGDLAAASENLRAAHAHFAARGDSSNLAVVNSYLAGVAQGAGDYDEARRRLGDAAAWFRRMGEHQVYFETLRKIAALNTQSGDLAAAEAVLREAAALARAQHQPNWLHGLDGDEARLRLRQGDLAAAERLLARYLADADSSEHLRRFDARVELAGVHARRGQLDRAAAELVEAQDGLDAWRATLSDRETRVLAFQTSASERDQLRDGMARALHALAVGGRPAAAFALAERRRARELADQLQQAAALRTGAPADSATPRAARPASGDRLASSRALLDDSTALLEYVTGHGGTRTTLFVVTRGGVRARSLPPVDSLAPAVANLVSLYESGADGHLAARALGTALLDPALALLAPSVRHLVVVPDGVLHRLPFDGLLLGDGRYVVQGFTVARVPSAAVGAMLRAEPRAANGGAARILAFGDPRFAGAEAREPAADGYRSAFEASGGLPRLAESGREARLVARYAPGSVVRLREEASAAYLAHAPLDSFRVLHFATHALVDDRSVARTALALAPGDGGSGFVGPGDLAALRLNADLVVLSACRSAGGVVVGGEGVQGLTAPLLQAGARAVVATAWRIDDRRTVDFVRAFYDALAGGQRVGDALRAAKLEAIRRGATPGEWAAFQVMGDPSVRIALRRPAPARWPWLLAAGALLCAGAAYLVTRRRRGAERRSLPS